MKIAYETDLNVPMQTAWNILVDFPRYPEWNPVFTAVEGEATLDSHLKTTVKFSGIPPRPIEFRVTACTAPKYFSFETHHRWGEWFLREEWIFRMNVFLKRTEQIPQQVRRRGQIDSIAWTGSANPVLARPELARMLVRSPSGCEKDPMHLPDQP